VVVVGFHRSLVSGAETGPGSWVPIPEGSLFSLANLPYGVFSDPDDAAPARRRLGVAVGDLVLDLGGAAGATGSILSPLLDQTTLNPLMSAGPEAWAGARRTVTSWLTDRTYQPVVEPHLREVAGVTLHLPFEVADYVDFYSSEHHAINAGRIIRPGSDPLPAAWRYLPCAYHGRSGTVVVSGTPVVRPSGQRKAAPDAPPTFGICQRLDIEAEVGFIVGAPSTRGQPVAIEAFPRHVFGACLLNDWSARDIQAWEYVPLGPFLGKSFLTSVAPWIVPLAALHAARVAPPSRDPMPLPYLRDENDPWGLDIDLEVRLNGHLISSPPFATMYWTAAQQLAHMTSNGASLRPGDLYGSGTVSGPLAHQRGSLMELSWGGTEPFSTPDGRTHAYLEDGDEVVITATAPAEDGSLLGFGEVRGQVVGGPAVGGAAAGRRGL
jgi:fumarylacetoacetase